jgi:hypothetical protein
MAAIVQQWSSLLPAALLDNHGVPGDWVTGSRTLDVLLLPVIFAISFPVLRLLLKKHIYQVGITDPFKQRQLYYQTSFHLKLDTYHACCSSSKVRVLMHVEHLFMSLLVCWFETSSRTGQGHISSNC